MASKYNDHLNDITPGPNEYKVNIDATYAVFYFIYILFNNIFLVSTKIYNGKEI